MRVSLVDTQTFSLTLFGLVIIGYQIAISLSCSLLCFSLRDCFGEHLGARLVNRLHSCRSQCSSRRSGAETPGHHPGAFGSWGKFFSFLLIDSALNLQLLLPFRLVLICRRRMDCENVAERMN